MSGLGRRSPVVSAVVLAAGASARMGRPKQLLPWGGMPMVRHVAETLAGSTASEVIVVVGCRADEVTRAVLGGSEGDSGRRAPIRVAVNSAWEDGMAASVACGVGAARADAEAFLITLSDHPAVGVDVIDVLIAEFAQRSPAERARAVLVPVHEGRRGHPTLLSAGLRAELEALGAARTLRDIVNANADPIRSLVEVSSEGIRMDLDTPSDYVEALLQMPRFASCIEEPEGSATDGN
ncbi:MAG TPA: nucleotidyltransferase family protein [Bacillota bacterium]|nr:nucleotidyltransferase family protein [Bacillota bacterium]